MIHLQKENSILIQWKFIFEPKDRCKEWFALAIADRWTDGNIYLILESRLIIL